MADDQSVVNPSKTQKSVEQSDMNFNRSAATYRKAFETEIKKIANTTIKKRVKGENFTIEIHNQIGYGGFSTVFCGKVNHNTVALKAMDYSCETSRKIAFREWKNSHAVKSRNVVKFSGEFFYDTPRSIFTYMSLAVGDLRRMIVRNEINRGLEVCEQILMGLKAIHMKNIIHRDMKPHNILYYSSGIFKIADFGHSINRETAKQPVGTNYYMAPEITGQVEYTNKVDVYATGLIMLEIMMNKNIYAWNVRRCVFFVEHYELRRLILAMLNDCPKKRPTSKSALQKLREIYKLKPPLTETDEIRKIDFKSYEGAEQLIRRIDLKFCCREYQDMKTKKKLSTQPCSNPQCKKKVFETILDNKKECSIGPLFITMLKILRNESIANCTNRKHAYDMLEKVAKKFLEKNGKIGGPGVKVSFEKYESVEFGVILVYWETNRPQYVRFLQFPTKKNWESRGRKVVINGSILKSDNSSGLWTDLIKQIYEEPMNQSGSVPTRNRYHRRHVAVPSQMATRANFLTIRIRFGEESMRKLLIFFRA